MTSLGAKPSFVDFKDVRFLMIDSPTDVNIEAYIREFKTHNVTDVVRACVCGYSAEPIAKVGIKVHDLPFPDGDAPPEDVSKRWLEICDATFAGGNPEKKTVAIHCVAGLGRTAVLVAVAMIEQGMEPLDAVQAIRAKRRGAINAKQLHYLEHTYKRRGGGGCIVM